MSSGCHHGGMPSSALSLEYLIAELAELELGLEVRLGELGPDADGSPQGERAVWRRYVGHVEAVARAVLDAELATLSVDVDEKAVRELVAALVGAARCRRLPSGSCADSVFARPSVFAGP